MDCWPVWPKRAAVHNNVAMQCYGREYRCAGQHSAARCYGLHAANYR